MQPNQTWAGSWSNGGTYSNPSPFQSKGGSIPQKTSAFEKRTNYSLDLELDLLTRSVRPPPYPIPARSKKTEAASATKALDAAQRLDS